MPNDSENSTNTLPQPDAETMRRNVARLHLATRIYALSHQLWSEAPTEEHDRLRQLAMVAVLAAREVC